MGPLFKFGQAVPEIFKFLYLEKLAFFRILGGDYEGQLKTGMVLRRLFFLALLWNYNGKINISLQPLFRFLKRTLILFQFFWPIFNKILFLKIKYYRWLGSSMSIWGKWVQNGFWRTTPLVRFSQKNPHFIENFM